MIELFFILIPIVITDLINPILFAASLFSLGSQHPYRNTAWVLFGFFLSYLGAGILLTVAIEQIVEYFKNPRTIDYLFGLGVGFALLIFAFWQFLHRGEEHDPHVHRLHHMQPWNSFLLGVQANIFGIPFALPYFAAIDQILIYNFSISTVFLILTLYNLVYILPFAALMGLRKWYGVKADRPLGRINRALWKLSDFILPIFLVIIAIFLFVQAIEYFLGNG